MVSPAGSRLAKPTTASRLPPVHALSAFEAAARLNSFALAADELCITPSALSHRIRLLEDFVGERLFIRDGRSPLRCPSLAGVISTWCAARCAR